MIPESFIQELLARVDIVDVVGRYVQLRKGGANLLGLCPFHNEKSPSFTVSPTKQFYHCFGCGAHGSAITFLMEHTGASFPEAVRSLASSAGMNVPEEPRSPRQQAEATKRKEEVSRHTQALEKAQEYYLAQLRLSAQARRYLQGRGLTGEIAKRYGLGWTGDDRRGLANVFERYDDPVLAEAGLVVESEDGRRYDRFRERVTFPIRNARGALIGFGGRIIGKGEPKYLNSPETPLFSKGQELYGLWEARQAIRAAGQILVVEGYMDVVGLAQLGVEHAVATLGTATTPQHVQKLLRASENVVFSFDGDKAGRRAAWRALNTCLALLRDDISIRFLFLPEEHDPDSYVRAFGAEAFRASLAEAQPLSRFLLDELAARHPMEEVEGRAACIHEARPLFAEIPECALKIQLQHEFARLVRLTPDELQAMFRIGEAAASRLPGNAPVGNVAHVAAPSGAARQIGPGSHADSRPAEPPGGEMPPWMVGPDDVQADDVGFHGGYEPDDSSWQPQEYGHASVPAPQPGRRQWGGAGRKEWTGGKGSHGGKGGKRWGQNDGRGQGVPPLTGGQQVASLPRKLLRLLVSHPGLIDNMGEQQLEVLDSSPHMRMVRELVTLLQDSGARHIGAMMQAVSPESELSGVLHDLSRDVLGSEELPNPLLEWEGGLHNVERDVLRAELEALVAAGLPDAESQQLYLDLTRRLRALGSS